MGTTTDEKDFMERMVDKLEPIYIKNFTKFYLLYPFAVTGWIISASQVTNVAVVGYFILSAVVIYYAIYTLNLVLAYRFRLKDIKNLNEQVTALSRNNTTVCENRNRIGGRFAQLMRSNADYYSHDEWDEKIRIEESGNTLIERDIVFIPGANGIDNVFLNLYGNELPADETDISFKAFLIKESGDRIALEFLQVWDEARHM
ncbi:hypothetical protein, partial [Kocuria rosea]|uniref:hypothetical protein n=1 Tax=Kocuria rosea TaxID=1275 RepID=UPI00203E9AEB|nr:hypothetical protein [Kocuria rosea]